MRTAILLAVYVTAVFAAGLAISDHGHVNDYSNGWNAGYGARQQLEASNDSRLQAAGLCVYASLACGRHK